MHGRRKQFTTEEVRRARAIKELQRVQEYRAVCARFDEATVVAAASTVRSGRDKDMDLAVRDGTGVDLIVHALEASADLLHWNPEYYSAWNRRKEWLLYGKE